MAEATPGRSRPRYSPTVTDGYSAEEIGRALSTPRFSRYREAAGGDADAGLELYVWCARISSAAYELIAHVEVVMRNAIDTALSEHYRDLDRGIPWLLSEPPLDAETSRRVADVRDRLRPQGRDSRPQLIAGLSFGFWSGMLGTKYEELWRSAIRHAFPDGDGTRKQVAVLVEAVRKFRNRLAHHDSVLGLDIPFEVERVHSLARLLGPDVAAWLRELDRTDEVYRQRPVVVIDTVVVAASDAWPLYEKTHAYVCQPARSFRPIERIGFYADQEVKAEVPRVLHRRDNVTWTEEHAKTLESSNDRNDRKVAKVIRESRKAVWRGGSYQVFLLSRAGSAEHRTLRASIPHHNRGRGSAFTQRQRYVSLHALETASTTAGL